MYSPDLHNQARDLVSVLECLGIDNKYDVEIALESEKGELRRFVVTHNPGADISGKRMALRGLLDGQGWTKVYTDYSVTEYAFTTSGIKIELEIPRSQVCRKVITGTQMVEELDYSNAPKIMVERETFRWECT